MQPRVAQSHFGHHEAIPSEITGRTCHDQIIHGRLAAARMHYDVVILKPHHLEAAMLLGLCGACPPSRIRIVPGQFLSDFGPYKWNAA